MHHLHSSDYITYCMPKVYKERTHMYEALPYYLTCVTLTSDKPPPLFNATLNI